MITPFVPFNSIGWTQWGMRHKSVIDHIYLCEIKNDHSNYDELKHFCSEYTDWCECMAVIAFHFLSIKQTNNQVSIKIDTNQF